MPERFVHLHLHSHYSLLDSAIRLDELVKQVAAFGMPAVALTDHGNLFGAYEFWSVARKAGVKPILGCELYVALGSRFDKKATGQAQRKPYQHLVVLAENQQGWRNLMELVTRGYLEGFYHRPRVDKELLRSHHKGLIALSACLSGEVSARLLAGDEHAALAVTEEYRDIFGPDNFFLELQDHGFVDERVVRKGMVSLARQTGIGLVATNDSHFHHREDVEAHRVLIGIGRNRNLADMARDYAYNDEFYVKSGEEMAALFADVPEAVTRTAEIAERCHFSFDPESKSSLPVFSVPAGQNTDSYLDELAREGLEGRFTDGKSRRHTPPDYWRRFDRELEIIRQMGFQGYFLVVWEFIRYARQNNIPVGPGRGSAAGSLVAYALRITDIDPLEYDLLFERFLNPDRVSMPDIDIDFCQRRRDEVIAHVRQLYGDDNVSQIATFNVLQARSCIRDVGRVMGMSFAETDRIAKLVPETLGISLADAVKDSPRLAEAARDEPRVAQLLDIGKRLEGLARHCGVHAAGVVIAPRPVRELAPLYKTSRDEVVTQFDKDVIEKLGLLKMDFLGLKTLTVIDDCVQSMRAAGLPVPDFERMIFDDERVYDLFCAGDTDGVFQFESPGMRDMLRTVQPRRFEEIAALNALYRPGPMQWIPEYTERKHGRKPISYIFPKLEGILAETYGVIVYQEQVMRIAVEIAGFTLGRADTLRKAMGKKIRELVDEQGEHFIEGALKNGYPRAKVEALWQQIVPFAQYGFNKSHSVAYAYVAYQTAWLKAYHREHFWAAMLSSETSNTEKLAAYVAQLVSSGLRILGPDINASRLAFAVDGDGIRVGLAAIKGVGEAAAEAILTARDKVGKFTSVPQFLRSLPERAVNRKVIECLVRAGAFDAPQPDRAALLASFESLVEQASHQRSAIEAGQGFLFGLDEGQTDDVNLPVTGIASREELLRGERDTLGFYLSGHPLERWSHVLGEIHTAKIAQLGELHLAGAEHAAVAGLVSGVKVRPIKEGRNQGRKIASFSLEDETGTVRVVAFADVYEKHEGLLADGTALLVQASLRSNDGDHVELSMDEATPLDGIEARKATALLVEIDLAKFPDRAAVEQLHDVILRHDGRVALKLRLVLGNLVVDVTPSRVTGVDPATLMPALTAMLGPGHVEHLYSSQ